MVRTIDSNGNANNGNNQQPGTPLHQAQRYCRPCMTRNIPLVRCSPVASSSNHNSSNASNSQQKARAPQSLIDCRKCGTKNISSV
ncbi:hypothetical protein K457DRAFT_13369 [Linnemannia elongata AG-77]|uniref:Uncharacterized protein n=1 Tax=Linnemannia elongata AG-77 TaxID=1314771 RepID=A0A197KGF1_9FUNG|nr:hypothetical protein K457DRAFT_13369 [Linnemannia elongata AG-77]